MAEGWISIHRKIRDNYLFKEKRVFSKFEAWIDLLLEVNHQDNKFILGNELVEVKKGSTITSIRQLCEKWGWSNTKVKKFFELLEQDEMITYKSDTKKTLVSIVNYAFYQPKEKEKRHENDTETTHSNHENDTETTRKHTNNNVNNVNNVNNENNEKELKENIYTEHFNLMLTKSEYEKIIAEYPKDIVDETIDAIKNTSKEVSKKYLSFNLLLRNWIKRSYKLNKKSNKSNEVVKDDMDTSEIAEILKRRGL